MIFATGGVAWLGTTFDGLVGGDAAAVSPVPPVFAEDSAVSVGWVVGGDLETRVTENFHVKAEYLYGQFKDATYDLSAGCAATYVVDMDINDLHTVRLGASYNFNFGGGYTAVANKW